MFLIEYLVSLRSVILQNKMRYECGFILTLLNNMISISVVFNLGAEANNGAPMTIIIIVFIIIIIKLKGSYDNAKK